MNITPVNSSNRLNPIWFVGLGLGTAAFGLIISGAMLLTGVPLKDAWLPAALMFGFGAFIALLLGGGSAISAARERKQIQRVLESPWASWRLFETEDAWHAAREEKRKGEKQSIIHPIISVILLGVVFVFITGFLTFYYFPMNSQFMQPGDSTRINMILAAVFVLLTVITMASFFVRRRQAARRHELRMEITMPSVYIAEHGMYRDDEGFWSLRSLRAVKMEEGALKLDVLMTYSSGRGRSYTSLVTLAVPVPAASRSDAEQVAARLKREVLHQ